MSDDELDELAYLVVVNDEAQYSIWRTGADVPAGWRASGFTGTRAQCLSHIDQVWTDLRPLSLRRKMEQVDRM